MDDVIKYIKNNYIINEVYNDSKYKIEINKVDYMLLVIDIYHHEWSKLKSFDVEKYKERIINNYKLCSILNIGPKLHQSFSVRNYPIMILEYLPHNITEEMIYKYGDKYKEFVERFHNLGIYHGDLHGGNMRLDKNMNIKMIDLGKLFFDDEININLNISINPIVKEWLESGYDIKNIKDFITYESNECWKIIVDD